MIRTHERLLLITVNNIKPLTTLCATSVVCNHAGVLKPPVPGTFGEFRSTSRALFLSVLVRVQNSQDLLSAVGLRLKTFSSELAPPSCIVGPCTITRYTHAHHEPHAQHVESCRSDEMVERVRDDSVPPLWSLPTATLCSPPCTYAVNRLASEVNPSGADPQVDFCHCYPVVFQPFVEQLTVFYCSGCVLKPAVVLYLPSLPSRWHHSTRKVRKLCVNQYIWAARVRKVR